MTRVTVYTLAWEGEDAAHDLADARGQMHSRVFIDGREVDVSGIRVTARGADFVQVQVDLLVADIDFESLTADEWGLEQPGKRPAS